MRLGEFRKRTRCALCCSENLQLAFEFPYTPLANEFPVDATEQEVFPLDVILCAACGHLQNGTLVDPKRLFRDYIYVTGTSPVTTAHFARYAEDIVSRFKSSFVVDIGSNDGTLLKEFKRLGAKVLGVDPAVQIAEQATAEGIPTIRAFFTSALAEEIRLSHGRADVVVANNVFAHAEDLIDIARGVRSLISDSGVFVMEVCYLLDVVERHLFDTIYHEHYSHHAVRPLVQMFRDLDMRVFAVERTPGQVGRGSVRLYVTPEGRAQESSIPEVIAHEEAVGLFNLDFYREFAARVRSRGAEFKRKLDALLASGLRLAGYGAPAKLTTLMFTFGLNARHCEFVVDDSPWKQGRLTPGLHIPVLPPAALYERRPDVCVVYAWNFTDSIVEKHRGYGGRFLVPMEGQA